MSNEGFVKLYRAIQQHPAWIAATPKYRVFLIEFMFRMTFKETTFVLGKSTIILKPNQYCSSADRMANDFSTRPSQGRKVKKEDTFTRGDIRGAEVYWKYHHFLTEIETNLLTNQCKVLEFKLPMTYEKNLGYANQPSNQDANQDANQRLTNVSPTKEEGKECKDKKKKERKSEPAVADSVRRQAAELNNLLIESIKKTKPDVKIRNAEKWLTEMRHLLHLDTRSFEVCKQIIQWLPDSDFWSGVIISTKKFRDNFDQLEIQMRKNFSKGPKKKANDTALMEKNKEYAENIFYSGNNKLKSSIAFHASTVQAGKQMISLMDLQFQEKFNKALAQVGLS